MRQNMIGLAVMILLMFLPVFCWILCLIKRIKAGNWRRHTLIYRVFSAVCNFIKSLWAGTNLTVKSVLIGAGLFLSFVLVILIAVFHYLPELAIFTGAVISAITMLPLLRYAKRLHLLEQGAASASFQPIDIQGGELGRIAGSINNIFKGINAAVEERLKSERFKTELITNVSHDIRTPLTSLIT